MFSSMLCTLKGRDKYGRPTEGVDEVPVRPKKDKQEFCLSQVVGLLQQANKREEELKERMKFLKRQYHSLYQEHLAYKLSDLCVDCQTRRANAGNGGCYEVCRECTEKIKTIAVLRCELVKKDEQIRYWQDCYETALSQRSEFPDIQLSQT